MFQEDVSSCDVGEIPEDLVSVGFPVFRCVVEGLEDTQPTQRHLDKWKEIKFPPEVTIKHVKLTRGKCKR